jgi:F-type H+-transporting ATPase subunit epsilon
LGTGVLKYKVKGQDKVHKALISWGYCEVSPDAVNVLAEFMQLPEEITAESAQAQLQTAEKKLVTEVLSDSDFEATMNEAAKARAAMSLTKH